MSIEQIFIGGVTAILCVTGLLHARWLLEHTGKGRRLVARFGDRGATRMLQLVLLAGAIFGGLLAAGIINPIRWSNPPSAARPS